ncbi:hypothetical protein Taro_054326 [Colocasia esculenta]|uniref:Uncharacterized protein n=1 Tax=Colocasia esculenta TaxID=4460 RepID=A0A843XN77_COLES|nr:hypothetical protein [Colocasia esculenta]
MVNPRLDSIFQGAISPIYSIVDVTGKPECSSKVAFKHNVMKSFSPVMRNVVECISIGKADGELASNDGDGNDHETHLADD